MCTSISHKHSTKHTSDLRRNNDKTCLILRQSVPKIQRHMCISLNKANRIRLIVSSTDISEEAELRLTSMLNETIKNYWVALGEPETFLVVPTRYIHFTFNQVENNRQKVHSDVSERGLGRQIRICAITALVHTR